MLLVLAQILLFQLTTIPTRSSVSVTSLTWHQNMKYSLLFILTLGLSFCPFCPSIRHHYLFSFYWPDIILSLFFSVPFSHLFSLIYSNAATTLFYFSTLSSFLPPTISTVSDNSTLTLDSCYSPFPLFSLLPFLYGFNFFCDHLTFYCIASTFYQSNQKALRALLEAAKVSEERVDQAIIENKGTAQWLYIYAYLSI